MQCNTKYFSLQCIDDVRWAPTINSFGKCQGWDTIAQNSFVGIDGEFLIFTPCRAPYFLFSPFNCECDTTVTICKLQIPSRGSVCLSVGTCDTSNISCYYCSCLTDWLRDYSRISDYGAQREERWKRKYAAVAAEEMLCMLLWRRCINNAKMPRRIKRNLCLICQFAKTQVVLLLITIIVRMDVLRALLLFVQTRYEWMYLLHLFYTISTNDDDDDIFKLRYYRHTGHRCLSLSPSIYLNEWAEAPLKKIWPNIHHHHRAPRVVVSSGEYSWRNASE